MYAVYEGNPYKYWIYGAIGDVHLYPNDCKDEAKAFADANELYMTDSPNGPCLCWTFANLVWDWISCGGEVTLHLIEDESWDEAYYKNIPFSQHWSVAYTKTKDGWLDVAYRLVKPKHFARRVLYDVLFDLYDIIPFEYWECSRDTDWKSVNTGNYYNELDPENSEVA